MSGGGGGEGGLVALVPHLLLYTIGCSVGNCCTVALMALEQKWTRSAALSLHRHFFTLTVLIQEYRTVYTAFQHTVMPSSNIPSKNRPSATMVSFKCTRKIGLNYGACRRIVGWG